MTEAQTAAGGEYNILVVDENDNPVPGVIVQFCTDTMCNLGKTKDDGIAVFAVETPGHIQYIFRVFRMDLQRMKPNM